MSAFGRCEQKGGKWLSVFAGAGNGFDFDPARLVPTPSFEPPSAHVRAFLWPAVVLPTAAPLARSGNITSPRETTVDLETSRPLSLGDLGG
jgi:hypothetical protein